MSGLPLVFHLGVGDTNVEISTGGQLIQGEQLALLVESLNKSETTCYAELERLKEAVWPGLPNFEPTAEKPQQNFYEAVAEGYRNEKAVIPAPPPGTPALCLVCAYEKPWGIWAPTGTSVCIECREKARQQPGV